MFFNRNCGIFFSNPNLGMFFLGWERCFCPLLAIQRCPVHLYTIYTKLSERPSCLCKSRPEGCKGKQRGWFVYSSFWKKFPFLLLHIILAHPEDGTAAPASEETPGTTARWSMFLEMLLLVQLSPCAHWSNYHNYHLVLIDPFWGTHHKKSEVEM